MAETGARQRRAPQLLRLVAGWNERVLPWFPAVAGLAGLAGTTLAFVSWWLFAAGLVAAAIAAASTTLHDWWRKAQESERASLDLALFDAAVQAHGVLADELDPIARTIAEMPFQAAAGRKVTFSKVVVQAVNTILLVNESTIGLRAVVYQISDNDQEMVPLEHKSRGHRLAPRPFIRGTSRGDKAFALIASGEALFVDDVAAAPQDLWEGSGNGYNTFISCPITTATSSFGMLTVDAVNTDDLTEQNLSDIRLIAGLLAIPFANRPR